ncbi:MAG: Response regulator with antiterminator output domain [Modestobacter sp.]|nr:Response regulator with antiterminator output domain [Modestobacter sp.]
MTANECTTRMPAAEAFEQLGAMPLSEESLDSVLQAVADLSKQVLPGDVEASVTVLVADKPTTFVYTGQLALDLDESQYGRGHGPCLHAASAGETVEICDARTEPRWADHMQRAVELDALSSLSVPLGSVEQLPAGLNVYARQPAAFDEAGRRTAERFARFAGAAAANMQAYRNARDMADNLQVALQSRATIDQAKGVLMERHRLSADQAFQLLARASMATNRKLRDVADHLVRTGELLGRPERS